MKIGIIKSIYGETPFTERYKKILTHNNIDWVELDVNTESFLSDVKTLSHVIFRYTHYDSDIQLAGTILPIIEEEMKIPCFPNRATCWHFDDKVRQYYLLKTHGFPFTDCNIFWDFDSAGKWIEKEAEYPTVFKLKGGAGSSNVILVKTAQEALKLTGKMFGKGMNPGRISGNTVRKQLPFTKRIKSLAKVVLKKQPNLFWKRNKDYVLFQKFLPNNKYDLRISVIGGRAFGFYRKVRDNDFRASGSGTLDYDKQVDTKAVEIALRISEKMGFQSMSYDFLYNSDNQLEICEISYTYQDWAIHNTEGYWDKELNWHKGHFWPQYFQLMDLLQKPNLEQPFELKN